MENEEYDRQIFQYINNVITFTPYSLIITTLTSCLEKNKNIQETAKELDIAIMSFLKKNNVIIKNENIKSIYASSELIFEEIKD